MATVTGSTLVRDLTDLTSISTTGNITVGGTVDGRDVATDGAKLDGIEASATADQTAGEILTAIKTVDGSGSGLDADTVDGIEATAITQSGDNVALTGDVTGATTVGADGSISVATTIAANSVELGTDTTGNYVATVTGTANEVEVTGSGGETAAVTVGLPSDVTVSNNLTVGGYLAGPASFTIDPAGVGDNTGTVIIAGDLQVDGTTTTINSTTVTVDDLNLTLASGSANAAAANGAGITVDGANATITYDSTNDEWDFNKNINITGNLILSGTVDGRDVATDGTKLDTIETNATADQTQAEINALGITATGLSGNPNISVGNITVSGTVDGRDVATDGTKLDTIETNATADQTAAEILTAIKTVDGASSGLDADLLDSQEGSYYLDGANFTGTLPNNYVTLGTMTTGNYVATIAGTANEVEVTGSGSETAAVTIGLPDDVTIGNELTVTTALFTPIIDTTDSSAITITPAAVFSSDVTIQNDLRVTNSIENAAGQTILPKTLGSAAQVLTVNAAGTGAEWAVATTGGGISSRTEEHPTVTNGAATVTMGAAYTLAQLDVYLNGARMKSGTDYSVSSTTLTFAENLSTGDIVALYAYDTSENLITGNWSDLNDVSVTGASANAMVRYDGGNWAVSQTTEDSSGNVTVAGNISTGKVEIEDDGAVNDRLLYLNSAGGLAGGQSGPFYGLYADIKSNNNATEAYGAYIEAEGGTSDDTYGIWAQATQASSTVDAIGVLGKTIVASGSTNHGSERALGTGPAAGVYALAETTGTGTASQTTALHASNASTHGSLAYGAYIETISGPTTVVPLKVDHDGSEIFKLDSAGNATISGTVTATAYAGDGSSLTGISAGATGGSTDQVFYENDQVVTTNYTISTNKNAMTAGPITVNSGVTVTIPTGSEWSIV